MAEAEEETTNSSLETTLPLPVVGYSEKTDKVIEETTGSDESTKAFPDLGIDGSISYDYAKFAASAVYFPFGEKHSKTPKKTENSPAASKKVSPRQKKIKRAQILPSVGINEVPNVDIDEIPSADISGIDESMEDFVVHQEEYVEIYDVPGNSVLPIVDCGHLFCRLGCICGTLLKTKNRPKISMEHCGLPECMLQCVCGYQKGKPSSRKCFASLLKGNESYYSKINWSSERQRRERRVPERFSEFHLGNESSSSISNRSSEEFKHVESKSKNSHHRAGNSHSSHPPSPLKNASPPQQHSVSPKNVVRNSLPCPPASRKWEPFRVKICADEIKLLRWDSFVSLSKVYIAPDHDIFCMEHKIYGCPCIETDRRIIRIDPKYVPIPLIDTTKSANNKSPTSSAKKVKTRNVSTSPAPKNVAKKHTNPNMRFVAKPKVTETEATPASQEQVPKASSLSKMRKILSDERFQLQKLMTDEKMRAFDEEVDLTVRQGQTVQLVAWIRFHRIYHAGRIHIRFLSRRAGPVILVMRPNEIVAADITCDIQDMKGNKNSPDIVKELLDPCISPEETSRYAFLLCDGVKWELVGCLSLMATNDAPRTTVPPTSLDTTLLPSSSDTPISTKELPPVILEKKNEQQKRIATQMKYLNKLAAPSSIERSSALELKRMMLEQRLSVINSKLTLPQPKQSASSKHMKQRSRASTAPVLRPMTPVVENPVIVEGLLPSPDQCVAEPSIQALRPQTARRTGKRIPDLTYLIPDQCILPDDPVDFPVISLINESSEENSKKNIQSVSNLIVSQAEKEPNRTLYPAAEKLAMFSRLIQNSRNDPISGGNYSNFNDSSEKCAVKCLPSKPVRFSPSVPVPLPIPLNAPRSTLPNKTSEVTLLKLQPIGSALPSGIIGQNAVRRIRILTPQSTVNGGDGNSLLPLLTSRNGLQPNIIQQQRMHWSSKGVKPPVISKFKPTTSRTDSLVTVLPIPTTAGVGKNVSTLPQSCAVDASSVVQQIGPVSNQDEKTSLVTLPTEDWSTQLLRIAEQQKKTEHRDKSNFPSVVNNGPSKEAELSTSCVFPKILTAEAITVKSLPGNPSRRLKIILEPMVGEHRDLCPSRASMILPLHNVDDQWCIVAIDHVPDSGLQVPGLTAFIPLEMLRRAASTAMERKARVSLPLHFKLNNDSSSSGLKADFEVYGTHQLPRHVFLGPFPFPMLNKNVCMSLIKLTKPIPVSDCVNEVKQIKPTEQTEVAILNTLRKSTVKSPEFVSESTSTIVDEASVISNLVSTSKATSGVDPTAEGVGTGVSENTLLNQTNANDSESDVIEIVDEKVNSNLESLQLPISSILHRSAESRSVKRKKTPIRMFVARTPGLPPANIRVFSENSVVVDHPFLCGEKKTFTSFENAKTWLQMLAIRNCKGKGLKSIDNSGTSSETSKSSNSPEDSLLNSEATEDEEINVGCGIQGESQDHEETETVDSTSTTSRSPKRIRRLTEKARILAATAKSSRNSSSTASKSLRSHQKPLPSPRVPSRKNSIQRMLHIQKEQERRGLLGKLIRDLDALCAPGSGIRAKIVVLKNATTTVKKLEQKGKEMENLYQSLKVKRTALLTQREQIFNKLPPNAYNIFNCLMESVPLPSRHLTITASERFKRYRPQVPDQQGRNRVAVVVPNNALLSESVDRDVAKGYVLTGVES